MVFVRRWGCRRLVGLLRALPADSAVARARGTAWSTADELAASIVDVLQVHLVATLRIAGVKNIPDPEPVKRPGQKDSATRPVTREDWRTMLTGEA